MNDSAINVIGVRNDLNSVVLWQAESPLFLTGFARSGTTWVNRLLREYFDAGFVNEGQFIVSFGKRLAHYGDLRKKRNHTRLLRDLSRDSFFTIVHRNYSVEIDWEQVAAVPPTFSSITINILSQIAAQTNKHRIGSKYPAFGCHLNILNHLFPNCKVIHVVRDGRDCALSHKGVRWGHQNTFSAAIHWKRYIQLARQSSAIMAGRYLEIRYEDLLLKPEQSMRDLETFVTDNEEFPITQRFIHESLKLKTEKVERWRTDMTAESQAIFEGVAGDMLEHCGYPLTNVAHVPSFLSRIGFRIHDRVKRESMHIARKIFTHIPEKK